MIKPLLSISLCLLTVFQTFGQSICEMYPLFKQGSVLGYTSYSTSDKPTSKSRQTVQKITKDGNGFHSVVKAEIINKKDKVEQSFEFGVACKGNVFSMDFKNLIPTSALEAYKDMEVTMEGTNIDYPENLKPGMKLPDGKFTVKASTSGMTVMDMQFEIINRLVEAEEELETPAGKFKCFVINQETKMVSKAMGIPMKVETKSKEWFSQTAGMVRTNDYNEKGKLQGYTLLSELKVP